MPDDDPGAPTAPNISTEHQREGNARRPQDTLDRDQPAGRTAPNTRGSTDDDEQPDRDTPGGNAQEAVEDRENVGTVTPDDYPRQQ